MSFDNPEKVQEQTSFVADSGNSTEIAIYDKRCVRRFFNGKPHGPKTLKKLLKYEPQNFTDFEKYVRVDYHNGMHNRIGEKTLKLLSTICEAFALST